jgi:hypothetical protein
MISHLIAFHRQLGCNDESSTDEEQAERILYYYPERTSVSARLSRVGVLESLIEFANKFSSESIDVVVMDNSTWSFLECEKDCWIVCGVSHDLMSSNQNLPLFFDHIPNGTGLIDGLTKMFRLYLTFYGEVNDSLRRDNGWESIARVMDSRKKIRKLCLKLKQEQQDQQYVISRQKEHDALILGIEGEGEEDKESAQRDFADRGNQLDNKSIEFLTDLVHTTECAIEQESSQLQSLLTPNANSPPYPPHIVSKNLGSFLAWYLSTGELTSPSALHSMTGVHFSPVGHPAFQLLLRVRQAVEEACQGSGRGVPASPAD